MNETVWNSILTAYGQTVTLRREEGETTVKAFLQPIPEKTPGAEPTPLGLAPVGKYLYLGSAGEALEDVTELLWQDRPFRILRHRPIYVGDSLFYRWAILEERDEVAP